MNKFIATKALSITFASRCLSGSQYEFMITITGDDPNLDFRNEYDLLKDVYYNGEPFTGVLADGVETIEYLDGVIHGIYVHKYPSGVIGTRSTYEKGVIVESTSYFEDGKVQSRLLNGSLKKWNEKGKLIQHDHEHYFENGLVSMLYGTPADDFAIQYFTPEGELIYTQRKDVWTGNKYFRKVDYNDDLMRKWYFYLLNRLVTDDRDGYESHRLHQIWMWFWEVFDRDPREYFQIVNRLLTHPDDAVVKGICSIVAIHKFHPYIEPENESNKTAYNLIREYTAYHDNREPDRETKKVNW